jgi:hypothetical protein
VLNFLRLYFYKLFYFFITVIIVCFSILDKLISPIYAFMANNHSTFRPFGHKKEANQVLLFIFDVLQQLGPKPDRGALCPLNYIIEKEVKSVSYRNEILAYLLFCIDKEWVYTLCIYI